MGRRGELTEEIRIKGTELLSHEISVNELRLMPYILSVMMNAQRIDPNKINAMERRILQVWREAGYIEGGASGLQITKEFYDIICELVFMAYVDID